MKMADKVISKDPNWKPKHGTFSPGVKGWKVGKSSTKVFDKSGSLIATPIDYVECVWTGAVGSTGTWVCGDCPNGNKPVPAPTGDDFPEGLVILVDCAAKGI
jgi:hypothetical protein